MKKMISLFVFSIALLVLSCVTYDYSEAEYYSIEEVIDTWEEGIYDYDIDQQMSVYWPDAYGLLRFDEDRYHPERHGKEEIRDLMEEITDDKFESDDFDFDDFELPEYVIVPEIEDEVITVVYYYEDLDSVEILTLTRRGDLWGVQDHYFHYYELKPVTFLTEWIDWNESGHIEPWERIEATSAIHRLLYDQHDVENGLDKIFDGDGNGYVEEGEVLFARSYFANSVLPQMVEQVDWFGPEYIDLDRNGNITSEEVESVAMYLVSWRANIPLDRPDDDPLVRYLDQNNDGFLEEHERDFLFWHLTGTLMQHRNPLWPFDVFEEETGMTAEVAPQPPEPDDNRSTMNALEKIRGKRIAVVDINSETEKINEETRKGLVFFVENSFVNTGMVKVVDRKSIEKIFEENRFQSTGMTDEETAVEIGKLVGAEIIVTGSVTAVGSNFYLQLRMIDVKTAEVVASSLGEAKIENEFLNMSSMAVDRLF